MLTLYHFWSSTCSRRVRICLAEKNIPWESHHIDIVEKRDNYEPWYVAMNPNAVVPTIDHDGKIMIESNIILQYLDEVFPDVPLSPAEPHLRAEMRLWMDRFESIIHRNVNIISYNRRHVPRWAKYSKQEQEEILNAHPQPMKRQEMLRRLEHGVSNDDEAAAQELLGYCLDLIETKLADGPYLIEGGFTLADVSVAPFIERFEANGLMDLVDFSKRPRLGDWWQAFQARPSFIEAYSFTNPDEKAA